jgi:hypothetical protein
MPKAEEGPFTLLALCVTSPADDESKPGCKKVAPHLSVPLKGHRGKRFPDEIAVP